VRLPGWRLSWIQHVKILKTHAITLRQLAKIITEANHIQWSNGPETEAGGVRRDLFGVELSPAPARLLGIASNCTHYLV